MTETTGELLGTGDLARRIGYSVSGVRKLEQLGVIPRALRVAGTGRRAWRAEDVDLIEARLVDANRRGRQTERSAA